MAAKCIYSLPEHFLSTHLGQEMPNRSKIALTSGGSDPPWWISCRDGKRSSGRPSRGTRQTHRQRSFPREKTHSARRIPPTATWVVRMPCKVPGKGKTTPPCFEAALGGISCFGANRKESGDEESHDHVAQEPMERAETISLEKQSLRGRTLLSKSN